MTSTTTSTELPMSSIMNVKIREMSSRMDVKIHKMNLKIDVKIHEMRSKQNPKMPETNWMTLNTSVFNFHPPLQISGGQDAIVISIQSWFGHEDLHNIRGSHYDASAQRSHHILVIGVELHARVCQQHLDITEPAMFNRKMKRSPPFVINHSGAQLLVG